MLLHYAGETARSRRRAGPGSTGVASVLAGGDHGRGVNLPGSIPQLSRQAGTVRTRDGGPLIAASWQTEWLTAH